MQPTTTRASKEANEAANAAVETVEAARAAFVKSPTSPALEGALRDALKAADEAHYHALPEDWFKSGRRPSADEKAREKTIARAEVALAIPPGSTVWTVTKSASRSGMFRTISVLIPTTDRDGRPIVRNLSKLAAAALGWGFDDHRGAVKVNGGNMDMGFHLVHSLAYACHGNDAEQMPPKARMVRGHKHAEPRPGYTLAQEWL